MDPALRSSASGAKSAPLLLLVASLWISQLGQLWSSVGEVNGIDFYDYYTTSHALGRAPVLEGASIYQPQMRRLLGELSYRQAQAIGSWRQQRGANAFRVLEPTSSPYTYSVWRLASRLPYDRAYELVQGFSIAAYVGALFGLCRLLRIPLGTSAVLGLALCTGSLALSSDTRVCNVNRLLVCGLCIFLWLKARAHAAELTRQRGNAGWQLAVGAFMVCMVAFKPVVGSMLALTWLALLCAGQLRAAALQVCGALCGAALVVLVAAPRFGGLHAWMIWLGSITTTLSDEVTSVAQGNYAPARVLESFWPGVPFRIYGAVLGAAVLVVLGLRLLHAARGPRGRQSVVAHVRHNCLLLGLGFAFTLCTSRLVWLHWQLLLTPCLIALAPLELRSPLQVVRALAWLCGLALLSLDNLRPFVNIQPPIGTACSVIAADAIFAVSCFAGVWSAAKWRGARLAARSVPLGVELEASL